VNGRQGPAKGEPNSEDGPCRPRRRPAGPKLGLAITRDWGMWRSRGNRPGMRICSFAGGLRGWVAGDERRRRGSRRKGEKWLKKKKMDRQGRLVGTLGGSTYYSTLNPTLISCSHPSRTSHELGLTTRASHKGVE
jgi:hypothetical protein